MKPGVAHFNALTSPDTVACQSATFHRASDAFVSGPLRRKKNAKTLWDGLTPEMRTEVGSLATQIASRGKPLDQTSTKYQTRKVRPILEQIQALGDAASLPAAVAVIFKDNPQILSGACAADDDAMLAIMNLIAKESAEPRRTFAAEVCRATTKDNYDKLRVLGDRVRPGVGRT